MSGRTPIDTERALAQLDPLRAALADALDPAVAARTWLVGGVVRDALLERELLDVDLATGGDPGAVAEAVAGALGGGAAFALGDDHGCMRVAARERRRDDADPRLAQVVQLDVCALVGGSLETDLAARDFAANALAVPLVAAGAGAPLEVVDHRGGLADVEAGVLRMVSERALDDDPLRMLRAARLAHVLDWAIDPGTASAIRARAGNADRPAGERTFAELRALLLHPECRRGWRLLEQLGLDAVLLPELAACRGMQQSRFHHLDVHDHTLAVLDNCEDILLATGFWLGADHAWSEEQRLVVLLAALCHDLGKPATRQLREDGRVSFVGHDDTGRDIVDAIAARWRWSGAQRQAVRALVGTHLALGFLLHTPRGPRERWRYLRAVEPVAAEAVVLSVGDRLATAGPADRRRWMRAHLQLAREVWADHVREQREGRPVPLLDGRALAEAAGIEPGPALGPLVTALAEAQAVGEVGTEDEARELARRFAPTRARG